MNGWLYEPAPTAWDLEGRVWFCKDAEFTTRIDIITVHPDEHDCLELGSRPAVAIARDLIGRGFIGQGWIRPPVPTQMAGSTKEER